VALSEKEQKNDQKGLKRQENEIKGLKWAIRDKLTPADRRDTNPKATDEKGTDSVMPGESTNVFVSYSHADASLVGPIVKLLRVNNSFVFQDIDHIRPGKKWRSEIERALNDAHLVVVFWCDHASKSMEVSNEWREAIKQEKDLLPLLLDETPLPAELGEFQWIDFRGTVGMNHGSIEPPPPRPQLSAPVKSHWFSLMGFATILIATLGLSLFTWNLPNNVPQPIPPSGNLPPPPPPVAESAYSSDLFLIASVTFAIVASLLWLIKLRSKSRRVIETDTPSTDKVQQLIANRIEAEMLRRTRK
jgi:hypothetical protein